MPRSYDMYDSIAVPARLIKPGDMVVANEGVGKGFRLLLVIGVDIVNEDYYELTLLGAIDGLVIDVVAHDLPILRLVNERTYHRQTKTWVTR